MPFFAESILQLMPVYMHLSSYNGIALSWYQFSRIVILYLNPQNQAKINRSRH